MKWTLGRKLVAVFLGLCAGPVLVLSFVSYLNSSRAIEEMLYRQTSGDAERFLEEFLGALQTFDREVANIAALGSAESPAAPWQVLLAAGPGVDRAATGLLATPEFTQTRSPLLRIVLLDRATRPVFRHLGPAYPKAMPADASPMDTVGAGCARSLGPGRVVHLRLGPPAGVPRLRAITPLVLPASSDPAGYLIVDAELARLLARAAQEVLPRRAAGRTGSSSAFALDMRSGALLHHEEPALLGQVASSATPGLWRALTADGPRLSAAGALEPREFEAIATLPLRESSGLFEDAKGEPMVFTARWMPELGLVLGVSAPRSPAAGPFARAALATLAATAAVIALSGAFLVVFSRTFRRGVGDLKLASAAVARGDFGHRVRVASRDELGELGEAFNRMAGDLERSTREREEAARFDTLHRVTSFLLHDLKGLVFNLSLLAENLEVRWDESDFRKDAILTLRGLSDRMTRLVGRVGRSAAGGTPAEQRAEMDLAGIVSELAREIATSSEGRVRVHCSLPDRPAVIVGDGEAVRSAIRNLLVNALEAMPGGGELVVSLSRDEGELRLRIRDTGPGIARELLDEGLFAPFRTTKEHGLGLGLHTSREVVRLHGGEILVESRPGEGAEFTVVLPTLRAPRGSGETGA